LLTQQQEKQEQQQPTVTVAIFVASILITSPDALIPSIPLNVACAVPDGRLVSLNPDVPAADDTISTYLLIMSFHVMILYNK
jgi:hypothetical protein